jgi:acetylglutamate kinase
VNGFDRVQVLTEALPYIRQYSGKTVVVKYGGAAMENDELREAVMDDVILLALVGIRLVLVHGGGPEINALLARLGKEPVFIDGLRYTDEETMEAVQMALCGSVNKSLVAKINHRGGKAVGLSGIDGDLFLAAGREGRDDRVGDIKVTDPAPVKMALDKGYIPVVSTVARDIDAGDAYNINADTAAAELAAELKAEKLILLTDVPGLLRDKDDPSSLIPEAKLSDIPAMVRDGVVSKGMIPKMDCCVDALRRGVLSAVILDGRSPHSLLMEMLTDQGCGTQIVGG